MAKTGAKPLQDRVRVLVKPKDGQVVPGAPSTQKPKKRVSATETKMALRRVRTTEGARRFGQPIGTIIRGNLDELAARGGPGSHEHFDEIHTMGELEGMYGEHRYSFPWGDGWEFHIFANDDEDPVGVLTSAANDHRSPETQDHYDVWWDGWSDNTEQNRLFMEALNRQIDGLEEWTDLEEEDDRDLDPDDEDDEGPNQERSARIDEGVQLERGTTEEGITPNHLLTWEPAADTGIYFGVQADRNDELLEVGFLGPDGQPAPYLRGDNKLDLTLDEAHAMRDAFDEMWSNLYERWESEPEEDEDEDESWPEQGVRMWFHEGDGEYIWQDYNQGGEIRGLNTEEFTQVVSMLERARALPAPYAHYRTPNVSGMTPEERYAFRTQPPSAEELEMQKVIDIDATFDEMEDDYGIVVKHFNDGDIMLIGTDGDELLIDRDRVDHYISTMRGLIASPSTRMETLEEVAA